MSHLMGKPTICIGENKDAFVFATRIVQFLFYLNPKFQASSSFLCLYRLVCVGPVQKPHCLFSHEVAHIMIKFVFIPPAKRSFRGVYCFQPVRHSVIPSFRDSVIPSFRHSVNIWTSLLNNLSSFCLICFKFSPHLHHQTIHVWYEFRGQRVSIARVMGLFKSSYNMFAIVLKVHTL